MPIPGQHRSLREPRVRNPLPRSTLDRPRRLTPSQLSRVISSDWPYWTGIARGPGRLGSGFHKLRSGNEAGTGEAGPADCDTERAEKFTSID